MAPQDGGWSAYRDTLNGHRITSWDALGRNVQYYDAAAIRAIVREAAKRDFAFSAIVSGIVESVPFTNRNVYAGPAPTVAAAREPGSSGGEP